MRSSSPIEVLKYLSENESSFISTTEIQDKLTLRGVLSGTNPSADRKKLNRTLSDLLQAGYVESRFDNVRGRKPQMWRLNVKAVPYLVSLSEEELLSLFTLISFVPRKYRNLEVLEPGLRASFTTTGFSTSLPTFLRKGSIGTSTS